MPIVSRVSNRPALIIIMLQWNVMDVVHGFGGVIQYVSFPAASCQGERSSSGRSWLWRSDTVRQLSHRVRETGRGVGGNGLPSMRAAYRSRSSLHSYVESNELSLSLSL
eukprot:scpid87482/ scgid9926/ 